MADYHLQNMFATMARGTTKASMRWRAGFWPQASRGQHQRRDNTTLSRHVPIHILDPHWKVLPSEKTEQRTIQPCGRIKMLSEKGTGGKGRRQKERICMVEMP
jgi:hypothetical protein